MAKESHIKEVSQLAIQAMAQHGQTVGDTLGIPFPEFKPYRDSHYAQAYFLKAIAEWLGAVGTLSNDAAISLEQSPTLDDVPLDHLTSDGLKWLAAKRGVDVSDLTRKADLIDALEG